MIVSTSHQVLAKCSKVSTTTSIARARLRPLSTTRAPSSKRGSKQSQKRDQQQKEELEQKWGFPLEVGKRYSEFVRSKNTFKQMKDSNKKANNNKLKEPSAFLIEAAKEVTSVYQRGRDGGSYRTSIATLNASPLLDPLKYCSSGSSDEPNDHSNNKNDSRDKARVLLRGKQSFLEVMKGEVKNTRRPRAYALTGHGVPKQLLQDHIDMADRLLSHHEHAMQCSFNNFHGHLTFDW